MRFFLPFDDDYSIETVSIAASLDYSSIDDEESNGSTLSSVIGCDLLTSGYISSDDENSTIGEWASDNIINDTPPVLIVDVPPQVVDDVTAPTIPTPLCDNEIVAP